MQACTMSISTNKRPRAAAFDDRYSSSVAINSSRTNSESQLVQCSYLGCLEPAYQDRRSTSLSAETLQQPQFCGLFHRDLFLSNLAESKTSFAGKADEERPNSGWHAAAAGEIVRECMLPDCTNLVWRDSASGHQFDFCGKEHKLAMVTNLTKTWSRKGRLCKLTECCRHVYVEDNGTCHKYCGMKHEMLAARRRGVLMSEGAMATPVDPKAVEESSLDHLVDHSDHELASMDTNHINSDDELRIESNSSQEKAQICQIESIVGFHDKICESELKRLLEGGSDDTYRGTTILRGVVDIYKFHPWELVHKFGGCRRYFLHNVKLQQEHKGRPAQNRTTKEGFCWKQSSSLHPSESKILETRYFEYQLKCKTRSNFEHLPHVQKYIEFNNQKQSQQEDSTLKVRRKKCTRWKMHEIILPQQGNKLNDSRMTIWMIFQDEQGQPEWPPICSIDSTLAHEPPEASSSLGETEDNMDAPDDTEGNPALVPFNDYQPDMWMDNLLDSSNIQMGRSITEDYPFSFYSPGGLWDWTPDKASHDRSSTLPFPF